MYKKISLSIPILRSFTHPILPHSLQSKIRTYYVDKIAAVSGFQRLISFPVYRVSESPIQNMDPTVHLALRAPLNSTTKLSI